MKESPRAVDRSPGRREVTAMRCVRCGGLMACEELTGAGPSKTGWCESWRCVNCGDLIDAVIFDNRTRSGVAEDREKHLAGVGR
jgi:hypothetical protein